MSDTREKVTVLGFDLGHGESAVAIVDDAYSRRGPTGIHPQSVFTVKSQPTVLATLMDGRTVWGNDAIIHPQVVQNKVLAFDICFKDKPGHEVKDAAIQRFAECINRAATVDLDSQSGDRIRWFVGCPSAWESDTQVAYRGIFERAGFESVSVVKESRAAFTYYYETTGSSCVGDLKKATVVLDFGSSTLDATLAIGLRDEELDPGIPLGAAWIDKAILEWNLKHCSDDDFPAGKQDGEKLARHLNDNRIIRNRVELMVRKAKEIYFNSADGCYPDHQQHLEQRIDAGDLRFRIALHDEMMKGLLNTPLEEIVPELSTTDVPEYIRKELVGHSWLGRCRTFLDKIAFQLQERGINPADINQVLLTGGASRMRAVRELVTAYFGSGAVVSIVHDKEPEMCIARGLACWGRTALQTESFEKEARELLLDDDALWALIESHCTSVGLQRVTNDKWAEITLSKLRLWRDGRLKHDYIGKGVAADLRAWAASGQLDTSVKACVSRVERAIRADVNEKVGAILERYQIAQISFLGETLLFEKLSEYFRNDCELIAKGMERTNDSPFEDLGDGWFSRNLLVSDNDLRGFVDRTRQRWIDIDVHVLYKHDHNRHLLIELIDDPLRESIRRAITATQYLLAADIAPAI